MKPCDNNFGVWFFFPLKLILKSVHVLHAFLMDCKPTRPYQRDDGCPAESKGGGSMPSVLAKSPTEPWHISHRGILKVSSGLSVVSNLGYCN